MLLDKTPLDKTDGSKANHPTHPANAGDHGIGHVVGVDIGGTNLRLALADLSGTIVARWSATTTGIRAADAVIDLIRTGVEALLEQASTPRSSLRAIAAGAPGVTNVKTGVVIATSYLLGWRDVPLQTLLEEALKIPAAIDNDVNLAALGESWAGAARNIPDFVFLAIGTGLGAGIFLDGRPFHGMGWTAGEIGYMLLPGTPDQPADRGEPGALEGMLGGEGIKAQWLSRWSANATPLPRDLNATQIFDHAVAGDPLAQLILQQSANMLASAIYNISLILNCPLFVLGGGIGSHPALCSATAKLLEEWGTRIDAQLALSTLGTEAQMMGAIRLALNTFALNTAAVSASSAKAQGSLE
jgi:glucokinase